MNLFSTEFKEKQRMCKVEEWFCWERGGFSLLKHQTRNFSQSQIQQRHLKKPLLNYFNFICLLINVALKCIWLVSQMLLTMKSQVFLTFQQVVISYKLSFYSVFDQISRKRRKISLSSTEWIQFSIRKKSLCHQWQSFVWPIWFVLSFWLELAMAPTLSKKCLEMWSKIIHQMK